MAAKTGTYTLIASNTLGSGASSVTFSSIPATYTDLVLVCSVSFTAATDTIGIRLNNDSTAGHYSVTQLSGNGTTASSARGSSSFMYITGNPSTNTSNYNIYIWNLMDYANTTTYKTVITRANQADAQVAANVGLWPYTNAVNQIDIIEGSANNFRSGSTFKLYGIEAGNL